ncbi:hypothetical protein [Romboutsia sp.]|nr:hypothetical protein [Romboutsia sp.]HSQ89518.1 hypothetical protein [Romboutsia sp.]
MELHKRKDLIARAKYLMNKYGYDALAAIKISEQEFEKQKKIGEEKNE